MPDTPTPPTVDTPIDVTDSATTVAARNFLLQAVLVVGAIVAALGLPATSKLAIAVSFLKGDQGVAIISLVASLASSGALLWRAVKKHRIAQTLSFLLPNRIARSPSKPSAAVAAAVERATVILDRRGAMPTRHL